MTIDIKFFSVSAAGGDGDGHTITQSLAGAGGAASAGDVLVVNSVSALGVQPVFTDNISGSTGWHRIGNSDDAVAPPTEFTTTKHWKLCVGGETDVTGDYGTPGNGRAFSANICRGMGALQEAYLIGERMGLSHFTDLEFGTGDGNGGLTPVSTEGEVYIGCSAIGPHAYSFASITSGGVHDNNGTGGAGENTGGGGVGYGCLQHINDDASAHHVTDGLVYGTRPQGVEAFHSFIGIRDHSLVGTPKCFSAQAYGGSDSFGNPGRTLASISIGGTASAGDWLVVGAICSAGGCGPGVAIPPITDNIDTDGSDWVLVTDTTVGEGSTYGTNQSAVRWWKKECAGGESSVTVDFLSSTNKAAAGVWVPSPTQPISVLDEGLLVWDTVDANVFTAGTGAARDHESYLYVTLGGTSATANDPTFIGMTDPTEDAGGSYSNAPGECWAQSAFSHDQAGNMTGDTPTMTVNANAIPAYTILFEINGDALVAPVNTVSPFIDNTAPAVGDLLTGNPGTWTGTAPITYTYQWLNYDGTDHNLSGETAITYTVTPEVEGTAIWLDVRAHSAAVAEPGVEAVSSHTDNVVAGASTDYTDAATVHLIPVMSAALVYTPLETPSATTIFDVGDHTAPNYVRSGRAGIITVRTTDVGVTFVLQTSPDGETWYNAHNSDGEEYVFDIAAGSGVAFTTPAGWFYTRLLCMVADDGPATVVIGQAGGY